jgi:hypothetical protein
VRDILMTFTTPYNFVDGDTLYASQLIEAFSYIASLSSIETNRAETAEALLAPINSPGFTGIPTAPTPTSGDNSSKIATTAFIHNVVSTLSTSSGISTTWVQAYTQSTYATITSLSAEISRAETAEASLAGLISSLSGGGVTEGWVSSNYATLGSLSAEISRAETAEASLAGLISSLSFGSGYATITSLNAEIARAEAAEASLAVVISSLNFGSNGSSYFKIPNPSNYANPWIVQFGNILIPSGYGDVITFPTAFPNSLKYIIVSDSLTTPPSATIGPNIVGARLNPSASLSSFLAYGKDLVTGAWTSSGFNYIAVGN